MRPAAAFAGYTDAHRNVELILASREAIIDRTMRDNRTEILVRADKFETFDDLIAQLRNLYVDAASFQGADQPTQGSVEAGPNRRPNRPG